MNNQMWKHGVESLKNECKNTIREKKNNISNVRDPKFESQLEFQY